MSGHVQIGQFHLPAQTSRDSEVRSDFPGVVDVPRPLVIPKTALSQSQGDVGTVEITEQQTRSAIAATLRVGRRIGGRVVALEEELTSGELVPELQEFVI